MSFKCMFRFWGRGLIGLVLEKPAGGFRINGFQSCVATPWHEHGL